MDEVTSQVMLNEAVGPVIDTATGHDFLEAMSRQTAVIVSLPSCCAGSCSLTNITFALPFHTSFSPSPPHRSISTQRLRLADHVQDLLESRDAAIAQSLRTQLLQYMWQQITPIELQAAIRNLYSSHEFLQTPTTYEPIRPFLELDICTAEDVTKAMELLNHAWGLLTQPANTKVDPVADWDRIQGLMKDIEEYFTNDPDEYKRFMQLGLGNWKEGEPIISQSSEEVREEAEAMLRGNEDLLRRFKEVFDPKNGELEQAVAKA